MPVPCFDLGTDTAALTHGHPSGQLPAGVLAHVTAFREAEDLLRARPNHSETLGATENAEKLAAEHPADPEALTKLGQGWVAEEALAIALYCCLSTNEFQEASP